MGKLACVSWHSGLNWKRPDTTPLWMRAFPLVPGKEILTILACSLQDFLKATRVDETWAAVPTEALCLYVGSVGQQELTVSPIPGPGFRLKGFSVSFIHELNAHLMPDLLHV